MIADEKKRREDAKQAAIDLKKHQDEEAELAAQEKREADIKQKRLMEEAAKNRLEEIRNNEAIEAQRKMCVHIARDLLPRSICSSM